MTPKEKAKEICKKYQRLLYIDVTRVNEEYIHPDSVKCALIAVDEVLHIVNLYNSTLEVSYWTEVKEEINNL